ncbi:hypothetical protein NO2_0144 [Candidatus Termititenax persephonae]|uniref:Uncharacterized protein n=1 Tax=Candidatus Termititenax persephonae TaxID=2218525 RepID=A0A388TEN9_9BACT|nr:hypothetical protein NO2_0144 [Candidatus Termititenax persephonae]
MFFLKNVAYWEVDVRNGGDMGNPYTLLKGNNKSYHIVNIAAEGSTQGILNGLIERLENIVADNPAVARTEWLALTNLGDLQNWKNSHVHVFAGRRNTVYWTILDSLKAADFKPRKIARQTYPAARVYGSRSLAILPDFEGRVLTPQGYWPPAEHALAIDLTDKVRVGGVFSHALLQAELKNLDAYLQPKNHQQGSLVFKPAGEAADGWRLIYITQENPVLLGAGAHSSAVWLDDFVRRMITKFSLPKPENLRPARAAVVIGSAWSRQDNGTIVINDFGKNLAAEAVNLYVADKVRDIYFSGSNGEKDVTKPPDASGDYPIVTEKQLMYDYACAYFDSKYQDAQARAVFRKHIFLDPSRANSTILQATETLPAVAQDLYKDDPLPLQRLARDGGVILLDMSLHTPRTQKEFRNARYASLIQIDPLYSYNQAPLGQARQLPFKFGALGYIVYEQLLLRLGMVALPLKNLLNESGWRTRGN